MAIRWGLLLRRRSWASCDALGQAMEDVEEAKEAEKAEGKVD